MEGDQIIKIFYYAFVSLGLVISLYFIGESQGEITQGIHDGRVTLYPYITFSFFGFLFGVFAQWDRLFNILTGNVKVSWMIAPSLLLLLFCTVPQQYWYNWFGDTEVLHNLLYSSEIKIVLTVFSGILFVRSLNRK